MIKPQIDGQDDSQKDSGIPLKIGITAGSMYVGLPVFILLLIYAKFWLFAIDYNQDLFFIPLVQFIVVILIGSYIVAKTLCKETGFKIRNENDVWKAGIFAALPECIWVLIFYLIFIFLDKLGYFDHFISFNLVRLDIVLFLFTAIIIIQVFMTWMFFKQPELSKKLKLNTSKNGHNTDTPRLIPRIIIIFLILTIVLPSLATYWAFRMDIIEPITHSVTYIGGPTVIIPERVSNDTIIITSYPALDCVSMGFTDPFGCVKMGYTNPFIDPDENRYYFLIRYNSKDISNQEIINHQGLMLTIDPPQGIQRLKGSRTVLKGPEISNSSSDGRLEIFEVNPSLGSRNMKNMWVDHYI